MSTHVPPLGLSSHLSLGSSSNSASPNSSNHPHRSYPNDNTTIDDFLAHQHPGAVSTLTTSNSFQHHLHLHHLSSHNHNNGFALSSSSSIHSGSSGSFGGTMQPVGAAPSSAFNGIFDNSSTGKPGSISPRPSRGVGPSRQTSTQNNSNNANVNNNNNNFVHHQHSLRRSPSMPSATSADINSTYYPQQSQYSFELRKDLGSLREMYRIHPQPYQLGNDGSNGHHPIPITAIAASSSGASLAWGDSSGRVFFLQRSSELVVNDSSSSFSNVPARQQRMPSLQSFWPVDHKVCYSPYVDPLSSCDVRPSITALAFLPEISPSTLLLTANEKTPKLWRFVKVPSLAPPIRSVDMIGSRAVGPLTIREQPTNVFKEVRKFNVDHERNIHSLCVIRDGTQFVSADETTIRLWNVEYEHRGLLLSSEQSSPAAASGDGEGLGGSSGGNDGAGGGGEDEVSEVISLVHAAPHAPHTLLVGLTGGQVRISDLRCNLKIKNSNNNNNNNNGSNGSMSASSTLGSDGSSIVVSAGPPSRTCDGLYRAVASATVGCDLSLCGNYIAQRDVTCLHLFDIRKASSSPLLPTPSNSPPPCLVNRWILQDHVAQQFGQLLQLGSLFEKVSVRFVGSRIVTGGFGECLISVNALDPSTENVDVRRLLCETEPETVEVPVMMPMSSDEEYETNVTTNDDDVARLYREARKARRRIKRRIGGFLGNGADSTSSDNDDPHHHPDHHHHATNLRKQYNSSHAEEDGEQEESTRFTFLASSSASRGVDAASVLPSLTADAAAQEHFQHHHLHNNEGRGEWRRVTKLCVLPSPSWVGIGGAGRRDGTEWNFSPTPRGRNGEVLGELLATCGDSVHHVAVPLS